jgi:hypothetical protein
MGRRHGLGRRPELASSFIHRSAWKVNSANFAKTEFLEVRAQFPLGETRSWGMHILPRRNTLLPLRGQETAA